MKLNVTIEVGVGCERLDLPRCKISTRAFFIGIKLWSRDTTSGNYAAAVVLWGKDSNNVITVRKALDFGTRPIETTTGKDPFECLDGNVMLPPVVEEWTRPQPRPPFGSIQEELESMSWRDIPYGVMPENPDWIFTLPADLLLYKVSPQKASNAMPYILDELPSIPDCQLNLQIFAWDINEYYLTSCLGHRHDDRNKSRKYDRLPPVGYSGDKKYKQIGRGKGQEMERRGKKRRKLLIMKMVIQINWHYTVPVLSYYRQRTWYC